MANICFGYLDVDCEEELFEEIREFVRSEEKEFDLNKIVPIPEDDDRLWKRNCWGTDRNVDEEYLSGQSYVFTTAWCPCSLAVKALAERYPKATFRYTFDENGSGFCGVEEYKNGRLVYELEADYEEHFYDEEEAPDDAHLVGEDVLPRTGNDIDCAVVPSGNDGEWMLGKIYYREKVDEFWGREFEGTVRYIGEQPERWY